MDPLIYKVLHLTGVIALFTSLGTVISGSCEDCRKKATIMHGVSLVLILISGFGMIAKLYQNKFAGWMIAKVVIWLLLGAVIVLSKRQLLPKPVLTIGVIVLGAIAAYLGVYGRTL